MITASEILQASNGKTLNDWRPQCEIAQKKRLPAKRPQLENDLDAMFKALGNDQLSTSKWAERMGWRRDMIRTRAIILMRRKMIKRTTGVQPYLFYKA
jgi:hypothetical protein